MNETVARIVELLFQDVEMTDEVRAIHDEVMNNCQERFGDLLGRGLTEDEAIAAVVESLKGMEEVLAGYPRRAEQEDVFTKSAVLGDAGRASFSARELRRLSVSLLGEDVTIEPSEDDEVHVSCELDENGQSPLVTELTDGELRVTRRKPEESGKWDRKHVKVDADIEFNMKDLHFTGLGDLLSKVMRTVQGGFDSSDRVRIQVPGWARLNHAQVKTTSGDVSLRDVAADALDFSSRSGDLRVELADDQRLNSATFHTTSGDIEAYMVADQVEAQSMSGDIRYEGEARRLIIGTTSGDVRVEQGADVCELCELKSVSGDVSCKGVVRQLRTFSTSGDIYIEAACEAVQFNSVSGDVDISARDARLHSVDGHTTSGDVTIHLSDAVREADVNFHSVSGDVFQGIARVNGAALRITVNTVSGDLRIG